MNACAESRGVTVAGDFMAIHTRQRGATEKVKSEGGCVVNLRNVDSIYV